MDQRVFTVRQNNLQYDVVEWKLYDNGIKTEQEVHSSYPEKYLAVKICEELNQQVEGGS